TWRGLGVAHALSWSRTTSFAGERKRVRRTAPGAHRSRAGGLITLWRRPGTRSLDDASPDGEASLPPEVGTSGVRAGAGAKLESGSSLAAYCERRYRPAA